MPASPIPDMPSIPIALVLLIGVVMVIGLMIKDA